MRDFSALVVTSPSVPSSDPACAGPPSPEGEGFGVAELGACRGGTYVVGGGMPPPYERYVFFSQIIEP